MHELALSQSIVELLAERAARVALFAKLPDKVRAPAKDWIARAKARQAARAAAQSFAARAARALGKG